MGLVFPFPPMGWRPSGKEAGEILRNLETRRERSSFNLITCK